MGSLTVTSEVSVSVSSEQANPERMDLDKRIRALKKKIRLTESQQASMAGEGTLNPEQREKLAKLDTWRKELKDLEEKRMTLRSYELDLSTMYINLDPCYLSDSCWHRFMAFTCLDLVFTTSVQLINI